MEYALVSLLNLLSAVTVGCEMQNSADAGWSLAGQYIVAKSAHLTLAFTRPLFLEVFQRPGIAFLAPERHGDVSAIGRRNGPWGVETLGFP